MAERLTPIPFVGNPEQRNLGVDDQRYVNVLFERVPTDVLKQHSVYCTKRPGASNDSQPVGTSTGRGIHSWALTGSTYAVFANWIMSNTSTLTNAMNTSSGRVWFVEIPPSTGNASLVICDGQDNYNITSTGVLTQIDQADDADYPVSSLGPVVYLDGYLFQGADSGRIYNTRLNTISSWTAGDYITADTHAGALEAIYIQKDQIMGFTKNRIEFFYNNGNPTGSPLLRIDQNTIGIGLASRESLAWSGEAACFVGETAGDGDVGRAVYLVQSLSKIRDISSPVINRFLRAEGISISSCTSWMERVNGQVVYCLNLQVANRSFVYSLESGLWSEWTDASGNRFNCVSATSRNGALYLQDASNGRIYTLNASTYRDSGTDFRVLLQTPRQEFGSPLRKQEVSLSIVGDSTASTLQVWANDDDLTTSYVQVGEIDMTSPQKRTTRLGGFYNRAHQFRYESNSTFRVQAWQPEVKKLG